MKLLWPERNLVCFHYLKLFRLKDAHLKKGNVRSEQVQDMCFNSAQLYTLFSVYAMAFSLLTFFNLGRNSIELSGASENTHLLVFYFEYTVIVVVKI